MDLAQSDTLTDSEGRTHNPCDELKQSIEEQTNCGGFDFRALLLWNNIP